MRLADLPPLLRDEPGLTRALGEPDARLAVVEVARPIAIAALASLSHRRPLVVACPTGTMAAQLGDDLDQFLPAGQVAVFPAWETLPFERVSPSVETMGQRLELLWRLARPGSLPGRDRHRRPRPAAASRPGRHDDRPDRRPPGDVVDPDELVRRLVDFGYRREELVEHRGEFARRGAIIDVFPSTGDSSGAHRPVGRRGRSPDPLRRQRPALHRRPRRGADLPGPRADPDRRRAGAGVQARRRRAVGPRAVGAAGRGRPVRRHGELAAVARGHRRAAHRRAPRHAPRSCSSSRGGCATGRSTCSPRRTTWPRRWRRRGSAIATSRSRACTPSPIAC